jgi:superfamily II DNA or RNA helicase
VSHAPRLREYQLQALAAEDAYRAEHPEQNRLALILPCGLGKTITFAERARRFLDHWRGAGAEHYPWRADDGSPIDAPPRRVLILVHTDELTDQSEAKCRLMCAPFSVGVVKAGRNEVDADIIVASVQTLSVPGRKEQIADVGYVIVDEVQYGVTPMWTATLEHFDCILPDECPEHGEYCVCLPPARVPMLGVTATLARSDGKGFGDLIHEAVFTRSTSWAVRKGYLIDLVPFTIRIPDMRFAEDASRLDAQLADSIAPEAVVDAWLEKAWVPGEPSRSTVLFAPLVKSARAFAEAFEKCGVKAEVVHGEMPKAERRAVLERYEAGVTTVVCNAMALTVGWDSPRTMCVIVARPTKSVPLFVQMVGRGLRPWLSADAPPREEQRCILLAVSDGVTDLACVADLSDHPGEVTDGKSLTQMEDEWDLGRDIEPDAEQYRGPVVVERWDAAVQASSKAWKYTAGGVPFLPTAKRGEGYVFVVERGGEWLVWHRGGEGLRRTGRLVSRRLATAPDLELAMTLAEDEAHDRGGDIGRLLADKNRPWRKAVPSSEMVEFAQRLGINVIPILENRKGGKAGRLSDLIDRVVASRTLDPIAVKIRERART